MASVKPSSSTSLLKGSFHQRSSGRSSAYARHLYKQDVLNKFNTRRLQLESGGRYKQFVFSRIISFLKQEFLEAREKRLTLDQLLTLVKEPEVSDEVKEWLMEEALPGHSKVRVVELSETVEKRFAYQPPLKILGLEVELLKLLKSMHYNDEGGLLRSLVEDSMPLAESYIKSLLQRDKITEITRIDRNRVLFYNPPTSKKLTLDDKFVELWRRVNVTNMEMQQIKHFLKIKRISVINDEALDREDEEEIFGDYEIKVNGLFSTRKRKKAIANHSKQAPKRPKMKIKDNVHVMESLQDLRDDNGGLSEPVPSTSTAALRMEIPELQEVSPSTSTASIDKESPEPEYVPSISTVARSGKNRKRFNSTSAKAKRVKKREPRQSNSTAVRRGRNTDLVPSSSTVARRSSSRLRNK